MAKDVITRFKLETTGFDSKIKEAAKELSAYSKTATQAKEGFNQFTKANVDAAKALGTTATSTTNVKDRTKELVGAYNEAAKAYEALSDEQKKSDWAKALAGSLTQLQQRIKETKQEMQGLGDSMNGGGGGIFSGLGSKMEGALAVFGGNLMTKAAGAVAQLGSEMADTVKQGIELAKAGEGVRIAFERLGNGQILDGLREATHGTVTDIELMKAAVKFNDFKLPIEELGTMLAFAQQKAKDTGQSVDYMVDSIVTGLGRKSLMILDNLGLSATEIRERMKETGDMTKAVGSIIRDQMAKAGDYVETAADRAAQANVSLQNKMEELGRKFAPIEEASNQLWTSMKIGILDIIGGPLARMLNDFTEAGRLMNALNNINGDGSGNKETKVEKALRMLREYSGGGNGVEGKRDLYNRQMALYSANEEKDWRNYNNLKIAEDAYRKKMYQRGQNAGDQAVLDSFTKQIENARNRALAWQQMAAQYEKGAQAMFNSNGVTPSVTPTTTTKNDKKDLDELQKIQAQIAALTKEAYTADEGRQKEIRQQIGGLQEQEKKLIAIRDLVTGKNDDKGLEIFNNFDTGSVSPGQSFIDKVKSDIAQANIDEDMNRLAQQMTVAFKGGMEEAELSEVSNEFFKKILNGENIPTEVWDELKEYIQENIVPETQAGEGKTKENDGYEALSQSINKASTAVNALSSINSGLKGMGLDLGEDIGNAIGIIQSLMTVIQGVQAIVSLFQTPAVISNTAALTALNTTLLVKSFLPGFANGGIVPHAAGGFVVPGNHFSGDVTPILANAGEVVLNRSQVGNLAAQLEGGAGFENLQLETFIEAEGIRVVLNNNGRRTGRGEYVQSRSRRG